MDIVTINCESALRSGDPEQVTYHLVGARKYYAIMLRHSWRVRLTSRDVSDLELRSVHLESLISKLEARYETEVATRALAC